MSSGLAGLLLRAADPWDIDIKNQTLLFSPASKWKILSLSCALVL